MRGLVQEIESQLTSANQKKPDPAVVKAWLRDLTSRLGDMTPSRLSQAFALARDEASERRGRGAFGQLALDDVIRHYRRTPAAAPEIPIPAECTYGCAEGHLMMIEPPGHYEVQVPCSCVAGEFQRASLRIYEGARNVEELLRFGWKLKATHQRLRREELLWLIVRSDTTSPTAAMEQLRAGKAQGAPLPHLSAAETARAAAVISDNTNKRRTGR